MDGSLVPCRSAACVGVWVFVITRRVQVVVASGCVLYVCGGGRVVVAKPKETEEVLQSRLNITFKGSGPCGCLCLSAVSVPRHDYVMGRMAVTSAIVHAALSRDFSTRSDEGDREVLHALA